jgi:cytoskeletal protein CcmA (bactofilin family)
MNDLNMNGKGNVSGGTYSEVRMDGISAVEGNIECDILELNGICVFEGDVRVKGKADIDGVCEINGDLEAEDLTVDGVLTISGDMSAENAAFEGKLTLKGMMNIGCLKMKLRGSSKIKEAVGGKITILHGKGRGYFRADLVEGDVIDLERSKVKIVRGDVVTIGKGCTVDKVEYRSKLDVHPKADVREKSKLS